MEILGFNSEIKKLRKDDKELTEKLLATESEYKKVYKVAEDWLRYIYNTCKRQFVLWRYGHIKEMLEECIKFLEHPEQYGEAPIPKHVMYASETPFEFIDVEQLKTKEEIQADIHRKQERREKLDEKIKKLKLLGSKYDDSKNYNPYRRYGELKLMIKDIIRN